MLNKKQLEDAANCGDCNKCSMQETVMDGDGLEHDNCCTEISDLAREILAYRETLEEIYPVLQSLRPNKNYRKELFNNINKLLKDGE